MLPPAIVESAIDPPAMLWSVIIESPAIVGASLEAADLTVFGAVTDAGRVEGAAANTVNAKPQVANNIQYGFISQTPNNNQIV